MYRASTPLYWIQNKSVFRFETFNERKNVFLYGSGLIYMWPTLFDVNENIVLVFYWLAFPLSLLGLYFFSGLFTLKITYKLISVLIFTSTPIIMEYYSYSLVQESWLGLLLLSFFYFLLLDLKPKVAAKKMSIFVGIALGLLGFIKLTGWFYIPLLLSYIFVYRTKVIGKIKYVFMGFIISLLITGSILVISQNINFYNSPFGSKGFRQDHLLEISPLNIGTQIARIPFLFVEFPVFSQYIADKIEWFFQINSRILGATNMLEKEKEYWWLGKYEYRLFPINIRFSIGGLIWFVSLFVVLFSINKKQKLKDNVIDLVYVLFIYVVCFQLFISKWAEGSDIPARHILSAYLVACGFFCYIFSKVDKYIGKKISFLFLSLILLFSTQKIMYSINDLDKLLIPHLDKKTTKQLMTREYPYDAFLNSLEKPTSFLVVESPTTQDYPLFWYKGKPLNKVYLTKNPINLDDLQYTQQLLSIYKTKKANYLVAYDQPKEFTEGLTKQGFNIVFNTSLDDYLINILTLNNITK